MPAVQTHCHQENDERTSTTFTTMKNPMSRLMPIAASPKKGSTKQSEDDLSWKESDKENIRRAVGPSKNFPGSKCSLLSPPSRHWRLSSSSNIRSSERCKRLRLLIGPDGIHSQSSFVEVSLSPHNSFLDIDVNQCPVIVESHFPNGDKTPGRLLIKTLKAAEDEYHETYKKVITKDVDPYCSTVKPYTRDFCIYVLRLDNSDNRQARTEVAKYKRRSMHAKYRKLVVPERSKRRRATLLTSIFNSILFAESVDQEAHRIRAELRKSALNNVTIQDCISLTVVLDNGHRIQIEREPDTGEIRCVNLPLHPICGSKVAGKQRPLFATTTDPQTVGISAGQGTVVVGRLDRQVGLEKREWNRQFLQFLAKQQLETSASKLLSRGRIKTLAADGLQSVYVPDIDGLYRHLISCDMDDDLRDEARRYLRRSLLRKYEHIMSTTSARKGNLRLQAMEEIMQGLIDIEQDQENEERSRGELILSSYLMDRMQDMYNT